MKLYNQKEILKSAKLAFVVFIIIIVVVLSLCNCSSQSHFRCNESITKVTVYCGKLRNISQATKSLYVVKTDKTEFFVWGKPEIEYGENLYITFKEENIMPGMSVKWVPYLIYNDQKCKVNEDYTHENFYTEITYANLEYIKFADL